MNVLVTGGAGYIGSHAVRGLIKNGHQVVVVDNLSHGFRQAVDKKALFVQSDISETEVLRKLFQEHKIQTVLHFAALIEVAESVINPSHYYHNNFVAGLSLLNAMKIANVKQLVFSSTAAVYGNPAQTVVEENHMRNPINPYGRSKMMMELAIDDFAASYGLGYVVLRYFNVAGASPDGKIGEAHEPETHLIPRVLKSALKSSGPVSIFGTDYKTKDGTCVRDYVHVEDLVDAHLLAMDAVKSGTTMTYNVGSEFGFSVKEVIQACRDVTKREIPVKEEARRTGDPAYLVASCRKIISELKWKPKYANLETIVSHAWNWHQKFPNGFLPGKVGLVKNISLAILLVCTSISARATLPTSPTPKVTYEDCVRAAVSVSEVIGDQTELVNQAKEREKQATGLVLPTINGVASYFVQDVSNLSTNNSVANGATITSPSVSGTQPQVNINLTQHLFRGFAEYAGLRQTKILSRAQEDTKTTSILQLQSDVAAAFFSTLRLEKDKEDVETEIDLNSKRIKELHGRIRIGRTRATEVLTLDSTNAALQAQLEVLKSQIQNSRDNLSYLTGFSKDMILNDTIQPPPSEPPLAFFLEALEDRPDIKSARERVVASIEGINIAKGVRWPTLDFKGNYYFLRPPGILQNSTWDAALILTLPLYEGGIIDSQVRFATSQDYQAELILRKLRKLAENEIRTNYQNLMSDRAQIDALTRSTAISRQNYTLQSRDYRYGLVANIDVVQALSIFQESVRALDQATFAEKLDLVKLQTSIGKIL